jgi:hypothetical protein
MKDKPNLSGWSVDRVKVSKMASHETLCFGAVVLKDDKPVGTAFNDGYGGQTFVTIKEEFLRVMTVPAGLTEHVDALVEDHVAVKDLARTHKRWMKEIMAKGRVFILNHAELKAWEAGTDHQESTMPPFRAYSRAYMDQWKSEDPNKGVEYTLYGEGSAKALWDMMLQCHYKWKALDDARTDAMLKAYEEKLKARKHDCPPASPQMPDGY